MKKLAMKVGAPENVNKFALRYGESGVGFRMELLLGTWGEDEDGKIPLGWDCVSSDELDYLIDSFVKELEAIKEYGRKKYQASLVKTS